MGFYENVKQTADKAGEKLSQLTDAAKIKVKIFDVQSDLRMLFEKLGKATYYIEGEEETAKITEQIDAKRMELENLEDRLAQLRLMNTCKECGTRNDKSAKYCSHCGARL